MRHSEVAITKVIPKTRHDMYARFLSEVFYQDWNVTDYLLGKRVGKEIS